MQLPAIDAEPQHVEAVVVPDDVVEEPAVHRCAGIAVRVDDALSVEQRLDPATVRADHSGDAVPGVGANLHADLLADLRRAELLADDVVEPSLVGVSSRG